MRQTTRSILMVLGLVVVAVGIAFAAAWAGRDEERKNEAKDKHDKFFEFDKNRVVAISIAKPGFIVEAERKDGKSPWHLSLPQTAPADQAAVNRVLDSFTILKEKKDLGDETDGKPYGLSPSGFITKVIFDDGKEEGLEWGVENAFDRDIYLRKIGEKLIRVVDTGQKFSFDKSPYDLRNKLIAELSPEAEITRIDVTGNKTPYVLEKDAEGWKVSGKPADAQTMNTLLNDLRNLRAKAVAADDYKLALPGEFGMHPPRVIVKLTAKEGQETVTRTILFSIKRPGAVEKQMLSYAKREDEAAVLQIDEQADELDKNPADLEDRQLVHADGESVRKLTFEGAKGKVEVAHGKAALPDGGVGDETFTVTAPQSGPANKATLSASLYSLTHLRATNFLGPAPTSAKDLAKYGLDKPQIATLLGDGGKVLGRVKVGSVKEDKYYVLVDGLPKLAQVERINLVNLPWTVAEALAVASK
ncbi:MAG TPA: DUF4340 domain-containing protein [Myxococcales bacterium]|nr:DUF4340 domain-containing protein [Myxococcales bacterium]